MRDPNCIFCKIVAGEIPSKKIYEDETTIAFLDIYPANPGHTLVVAKDHFSTILGIPEDNLYNLSKVLKKVASSIRESMNAEGLNILQFNGSVAGQTIPHLHFHLIPRSKDDGLGFAWPHRQLPEEEMEATRKKLAEKMGYRG
ncbi:MAG: HIT family protein [Candidatus Aenigmarchaeota archaeon]|nr:HIT family protein [Candidatus Aenigmarchaeota archaeon]